ncbi:MAG TPA: hypothetical protein VFS40_11595 [Gemmatimonadales bacterium]|nr:hypothetical protein [Gemmatimonadales bacterium]
MRSLSHAAVAAVLALAPAPLLAQQAAKAPAAGGTTSLTIYGDGRVLVRRSLPVAVPKGASEQRVALGPLDPASLFALDAGVALMGARYDAAVDETSVLRRMTGRRLVFQVERENGRVDTTSATVLGADPLRLQLPDGHVVFRMPGRPLYPADMVAVEPTATLALRSDAARPMLGLGWFTGGAAWQATYDVVLGRGTTGSARVTGKATVVSQELSVQNAEVQLLAGNVGRATPPPVPMYQAARAAKMDMGVSGLESAAGEERVGEAHVYTLPGRHDLTAGLATVVSLFEPAQAAYERAYLVRGGIPYWGYVPQFGDSMPVPVEVSYTLKRPRKSEYGDRPLPGGVARLYQADSTGRLQLVGEAALGHTPAGRDLVLSAGTAFDLTAKRVQTSYTTHRDSTRAGGVRTTVTASYAVALTNASDSAVVIDVREERGGEWAVTQSSVPAEKLSATAVRFRVPVPANGSATLTYTIRAVW